MDEKLNENKQLNYEKEVVVELPEVNFFEHLYRQSQKRDVDVALYKIKEANSMKILAQISAATITSCVIVLNNPEIRNTLITVIPTVYSGLTLAGSISSVLNQVSSTTQSLLNCTTDVSYTGLYLVLAGATMYTGYKLYSNKVVPLSLKMIEDLVNQYDKTCK